MATFPATSYRDATDLAIDASNQLHRVVNEDASTTIQTESGPIPSLRKAIVDNFYFKEPLDWAEGLNETVFNQLRRFTDGFYYYSPFATSTNPVIMGATPTGDPNWVLTQFDSAVAMADALNRTLQSENNAAQSVLNAQQAAFNSEQFALASQQFAEEAERITGITEVGGLVEDALNTYSISTVSPLQGGGGFGSNPSISILPASTTQQGVVQLNDTLTSTSVTEALTAAQGKELNDTKASVTYVESSLENKEDKIAVKNTAFNKNFGTTSDTIAEGNDSRIVNAVQNTTTINGKPLSGDITLTASDIDWEVTTDNVGVISGNKVVWLADSSTAPVTRQLSSEVVELWVRDINGNASLNNIQVVGDVGVTINGNPDETIDANYGWVRYRNINGDFKTVCGG